MIAPERDVYPLSSGQTRIWFLDQLIPGNTAYNISCAYRLRGPLDVAALSAAFSDLVRRHDTLRSRFILFGGSPGQVIEPAAPAALPVDDLTGEPEAGRLPAAQAVAARLAAEPFDLSAVPLYRHRLLRLGDDDHMLALVIHHIVCDGWSLRVLWRDLGAHYLARQGRAAANLPPLPVRYVDHVLAIREADPGDAFGKDLAYWRGRLEGLEPLGLPTDRAYPADRASAGGRVPVALGADLVGRVRRLSRQLRVTPFMILLAAFQLLLARWSGQEDIAVGSPVAGRSSPDLAPLIGLFANTLVLRTDLSGDPPFRELAGRVREVVLDAMDHQGVPFDRLVAELQPAREPNRHPYFQVMLSTQDEPLVPDLAGLVAERVPVRRDSAQFDLSLSLFTADGAMYGDLEFAADIFDAGTIGSLRDQLGALLTAVTDDPDRRGSVVPLSAGVPPAPRLQSVVDDTVTALLERPARRSPDAVAIHADRDITYAELHDRADQLAAMLRERGIGPDVPVGLHGERSAELVVGALGILKAGGACLPLSTVSPPDRVRAVMRAAGAALMLIGPGTAAPYPDATTTRIPAGRLPPPPGGLTTTAAHPDQLAFVLPTSGSSGEPKLVALTHRNLGWFMATVLPAYRLSPADRLLGFWPHGSDGAIEETLLTLCAGATLVLADHVVETAARFARLCARLDITVVMLPTAYWHHLADGLREQAGTLPGSVRLVTFGGERASPDRLVSWLAAVGTNARLVNEYGPSETTIFATAQDLTAIDRSRHVPIGTPIGGMRAHVLDPALRPVPHGVVGELYLGGAGVARCYLGDPPGTAARFVADPFTVGGRLFRTGDLVRIANAGSLEFIGRTDHQLKVHGYRVEPAEVEAALAEDPAVTGAAVIGDAHGLTGYIVSDADAEAIRARLAERLPAYMVPARLVTLDRIPMTATGKVDRRALPAEPAGPLPATPEPVAPSTPVETALARLWQRVLRRERIGVQDRFYDLGGHSLQAVQIAAGAAAAFGVDVPVSLVLRRSTIAGLAQEIEMLLQGQEPPPIVPRSATTHAATGVGFRRFVTRPLAALIEAEEMPPVHAASISCIPERALAQRQLTVDEYLEDWCQGVPIISGVKETPVGRIAQIVIPYLESEVYRDLDSLIRVVVPGLRLAHRAGASVVSLINLLSSATSHGVALRQVLDSRPDLPRVTTGHAMTTAAVLLNLRHVMAATGRDLAAEDLAVLGLGSIGRSVLRLLLRRLPHPQQIRLCDVYSRRDHLEEIREEARGPLGYRGPVTVLTAAEGSVPDELYESSTILAATNVPRVLDVDRLAAGCIVLDDSVPHCFDPASAAARSDVLCAEGGELHSRCPMSELRYVPRWVTTRHSWETIDSWYEQDPYRFGGCVIAAALAAGESDVPVTVGVPEPAATEQALDLLPARGFRAVPPQCDNHVFSEEQLARIGRSGR